MQFWAPIQKYGGLGDGWDGALVMRQPTSAFGRIPRPLRSRCSHLESGALFPLSLYLAVFVPDARVSAPVNHVSVQICTAHGWAALPLLFYTHKSDPKILDRVLRSKNILGRCACVKELPARPAVIPLHRLIVREMHTTCGWTLPEPLVVGSAMCWSY